MVILFVSQLFRRWSDPGGSLGLSWHFTPQGNCLQLVLVVAAAVAERGIWIKICNLKDGGYGDKDRDVWERRGDITIIRASSFAHKPKLSPQHHPQNSLWSVVTPIKPAKLSLSSQAADLRTPRQQIGLGEGLQPDKGGSLPLLLYLKSITQAFTFSVSPPHLPPCLPLLVSSDSGLGPAPHRVLMLNCPFRTSPTLDTLSPTKRTCRWRLREWSWCWRKTTWCRLRVYVVVYMCKWVRLEAFVASRPVTTHLMMVVVLQQQQQQIVFSMTNGGFHSCRFTPHLKAQSVIFRTTNRFFCVSLRSQFKIGAV